MNTSNEGNNNNNDDFDNNPSNNNNDKNEERRRKGKGRKKISIEKIENKANLQVTFSKRRAGAFKKASELSTLSEAESAIVVFSPGNKPFSFGHPSVESVADRFLNNSSTGSLQRNAANHLEMALGEAAMHLRNHELASVEDQVERERKSMKQLDDIAPSLDQLNSELTDHMNNFGSFLKHTYCDTQLKGNGGESSSRANPGTHQDQGFGSLAPRYGYGVPTNPSVSSFTSFGDQFGHTLPYPPTGPSSFGFNYGNNVAPYDGMERGSGSGTGTWNTNENPLNDEDPDDLPQGSPDHGTGFGGNYGPSF